MANDDDNGDHKNTCVICLERLNDGVIGAATPCGHCFHESCFEGWRHSQNRTTPHSPWYEQIQPVKCPMCNKEAAGFCRIYLDLTALGSEGVDGDDDSDSDSEDDDDDSSSRNSEEEENDDEGDDDATRSQEGEPDRSPEESGRGCNTALTSSAAARAPGDIEIIEINDDDDDDDDVTGTAGMVGKGSTSTKGTCEKSKKKNYKARAKLLKRRIKVLESQRNEQYEELREIQDKFGKNRAKVSEMEVEMEGLRSQSEMYERERECTALQLVRLTREKDELSSKFTQAAADKDRAERRLDEARKEYERELQKAQANSMSEVQKMLTDHPHLIRENRELKLLNEKYKLRVRELQSEPQVRELTSKQQRPALPPVRDVVIPAKRHQKSSSSSTSQAPAGRHAPVPSSAFDAVRKLSALDDRVRAEHQKKRDKDERHAQSVSDMMGKVSAHAARFTTARPAGEKQKKARPLLASLSLLDANKKGAAAADGRSGSQPKRSPSQLLPITMPLQKRPKQGSFLSSGNAFLSSRR